jgi:hypothetical protein
VGLEGAVPVLLRFHGRSRRRRAHGRRSEYAWAYAKYGDEIPDPLAKSTFQLAVLDWESRNEAPGKQRLALVRDLLAIRRREIVPRLAGASFGDADAAGNGLLTAHWRMGDGAALQLVANLSNSEIARKASAGERHPDLGRRSQGLDGRPGRCSGASEGDDAPAIPIATYRVPTDAELRLRRRRQAIVPYLNALGITHFYASPFMKARKGSTHGYDIVDHTRINPELGGDAGFERLSNTLKQHGLGLILDFRPQPCRGTFRRQSMVARRAGMGSGLAARGVVRLRLGHLPYRARGGVLLPIIGSSYGQALEKGEIELRYDADEGSFSAWYFEHRLPIAPERYSEILRTS